MFGLEHLLKVVDPDPIAVDHMACLRARHRRSACRACTDICPDAALTYEEGRIRVDSAACTRCSLCAGACPTGAISIRGVEAKSLMGAARIRCSRTSGEGNVLPCLGWLTVDHMMAIALRTGEVELRHADCQACPWRSGGQMAAAAAVTANEALRLLGRPAQVTLTLQTEPAAAAARTVSRRELFAFWATEGTQVARQLMPERDVNPAKLPARVPAPRVQWLKQVDPAEVTAGEWMPDGPWKARVASPACTGCSICVAFCPTGALSQISAEGEWALLNQPAACVSCGTCEALCPVKAISAEPMPVARMAGGDRRELIRLVENRCSQCRKSFKGSAGDQRCPQCSATYGMLRI